MLTFSLFSQAQAGDVSFNINWGRRLAADDMIAAGDAHNAALCYEINDRFADAHMIKFASTMISSKPMTPTIVALASEMAKWAEGHVERRRAEGDAAQEWDEFVDAVVEAGVVADTARRLANNDMKKLQAKITRFGYSQAAGYAAAVAYLAEETGKAKGADVFAVNARGGSEEKVEGCGSVVNFVNAKLEDSTGLDLANDEDGHKIVVVSEDIASRFGKLVSLVTLASGGLAFKLMNFCNSYVDAIDMA